jgi:hypothetical protein
MKNTHSQIKKLLRSLSKPLAGNNRSFSMRATRRKFATNRQKFLINGKKYYLPVKLFRSWTKQQKSL